MCSDCVRSVFPPFSLQSSRVDKLQTELSSQRDKLEEANRLQSRLKEMKTRNESIMEAKVTLEDQLEDLQGKLDTLDMIQKENAQLKAQVDALNMVRMKYKHGAKIEGRRIKTCFYQFVINPRVGRGL